MSIKRIYDRMVKSQPFEDLARLIDARTPAIPVRGLPGSLTAFGIAWVEETAPGPVLVVCASEDRAEEVRDDLERVQGSSRVGIFPA